MAPATTTSTTTFMVPGPPRPKGRPRLGRRGLVYTPRQTRHYEEWVAFMALQARVKCARGPVRVTLRFWFADERRRDLDNCAKAVLDALTGLAWDDDSQVHELHTERGVDRENPRTEITIEPRGPRC